MKTSAVIGCVAVALLAAGCGGGHEAVATTTPTIAALRADPQERLTTGVREHTGSVRLRV